MRAGLRSGIAQLEQLADLHQGEAQRLRLAHEAQAVQICLGVKPKPARRAMRLSDKPLFFIETDGVDRKAAAGGYGSDLQSTAGSSIHEVTIQSGVDSRVKSGLCSQK